MTTTVFREIRKKNSWYFRVTDSKRIRISRIVGIIVRLANEKLTYSAVFLKLGAHLAHSQNSRMLITFFHSEREKLLCVGNDIWSLNAETILLQNHPQRYRDLVKWKFYLFFHSRTTIGSNLTKGEFQLRFERNCIILSKINVMSKYNQKPFIVTYLAFSWHCVLMGLVTGKLNDREPAFILSKLRTGKTLW